MKATISAVAILLASATSVVARDCKAGNEYCAESLMHLNFPKYIGPIAVEIIKHGNVTFDHVNYSNLSSLENEIYKQLGDPFPKAKFVCMPHGTILYAETCEFGCGGVKEEEESDYCFAEHPSTAED
ncbi:DNA polymerase epsilon catalytic subunit [Pestalotiopsis sp. IQ-011]